MIQFILFDAFYQYFVHTSTLTCVCTFMVSKQLIQSQDIYITYK
jgi:hypothetical protein